MEQWKKLGHILIEDRILTPVAVARLLAISKRQKKRFGWTLEDLGLVTGDELATALSRQFGLQRITNLVAGSYDREVLNVFDVEFALEHLVFPVRFEERKLVVAVADPTDMKALNNFGVNHDTQIMPCVASRRDIHEAICKFYLGKLVQESRRTTVLVVDDDVLTQTILRDILTSHGYRVVIATDGIEGFRETIANRPHIILADKVMPKLDGFAMLNSLKAIPEFRAIPVILISDKMTDEDEARVFGMGFFDYIPKPVKEITLISRIERALGRCESGGLPSVED
jgi:CheY-like chemotaxis protein